MNERLVKSVAQTILAMSAEERQFLEEIIYAESSQASVFSTPENSIATNGTAHQTQMHSKNGAIEIESGETNDAESASVPAEDEPLMENSFLRMALSLQLEGPTDWSANVDHYLYGAPKQND